ncbi:hypothetical protein Tco_0595179 [Tanacetum coccineum]
MATMAENVIAAGSETRKENGEMLKDSIENGPYKFKSEIIVKDTNDVTDICRAQRHEDLAGDDKVRYDSDITSKFHMAKKCTARKRVKDSEWFKEKMLLAQAQEIGVVLNDDQQDFLADNLEETNDYDDL